MVKIIENNATNRCRYQFCNSLLEYSIEDKQLIQVGIRQEEYQIYCPACNRKTKISSKE